MEKPPTRETLSIKSRVISELMKETMDYVTMLEKQITDLREEIEFLQSSEKLPELLTVKIMVKHSPFSSSRIGEFLKTGEIKGRKLGKKWVADREDFLAFVKGEQAQEKMKLAKAR